MRITDVSKIPPFNEQGQLCERGVVACLGVPLRTEDGYVLGSLCAIHKSPREWTGHEVELMRAVAEAVMS